MGRPNCIAEREDSDQEVDELQVLARAKLRLQETKTILMEKKFGIYKADEYKKVNHQIIHHLKDEPKFAWTDLVQP